MSFLTSTCAYESTFLGNIFSFHTLCTLYFPIEIIEYDNNLNLLNFIPGKNIRHIENDVYTEIEAGSGKYKKGHVVSQIRPSAINIEINNEVNF